jgi:cation:H+ antiporter
MISSVFLVILGLILLVAGGELLLRGAVTLATIARVTPAVIGLTVVAAGTSVPELAVSLIAALRGNQAVAIGNIVGSNIFNITIILGLAALIRPLAITGNTIRLEYPVLALVSLLFIVVCHDGSLGRLDGILFIAVYIGFTAYLVRLVRKQMSTTELSELVVEVKELTQASGPRPNAMIAVGLLAAGVGLLVGGAHATVTGAVELGRLWGMSERLIGLTIVAVGTGLPEVVTSLVSSIRGRDDVAIGNVIGSNLFNILGTLGISGLIHPLSISKEIIGSDNWWMFGLTLLLFPIIFSGRRIARWEGALLLACYGIYLTVLLGRFQVI